MDILLKENEQVRKPSLNWPSIGIIFPCDPVNHCLKINLFKAIETGFEYNKKKHCSKWTTEFSYLFRCSWLNAFENWTEKVALYFFKRILSDLDFFSLFQLGAIEAWALVGAQVSAMRMIGGGGGGEGGLTC